MIKTFSFNSTAENWTATVSGATSLSLTRDTTASSDADNDSNAGDGTLQARRTGRNLTDGDAYWEWAGTWEDLGVPAGATVTQCDLDYDWSCPEYTTGASTSSYGPSELRDSGGTLRRTFLGSGTFSTTSGWNTANGAVQTGLTDASNTSIRLRIGAKPNTGNSLSAAVTLRLDWVVVTIAYEQYVAGGATGSGTAVGGVTLTKPVAGALTGAATASGAVALTVPLAGAFTGSTALAGGLLSSVPLAGAMTGAGSATGALTVPKDLAGGLTAGATAAGELFLVPFAAYDATFDESSTDGDPLFDVMWTTAAGYQDVAGAFTASATAAGAADITKPLSGALTGGATLVGLLSINAVECAGAMTAGATVGGALFQASLPAGNDPVFDTMTVSGSALFDLSSVGSGYAGAMTARATAAATLTTVPAVLLAGAATASAGAAAALGNRLPIWAGLTQIEFVEGSPGTFNIWSWMFDSDGDTLTVGVVPSLPSGFAILQNPPRITYNGTPVAGEYGDYYFWADDGKDTPSGVAWATGVLAGDLSVTRDVNLIAGGATGSATLSQSISVTKSLVGAMTASAGTGADLSAAKELAGAATAAVVASGRLFGTVETIELAGDALATATAASDLGAVVTLAGAGTGAVVMVATISNSKALQATPTATATGAADLGLTKFLSGAMTAGATASALGDAVPRGTKFRPTKTTQFTATRQTRYAA